MTLLRCALLTSLVLLISLSSTSARLWDTESQVEARYGKPLRVEGDQTHGKIRTYNFERFRVTVTFLNDQSQSELYYRSDNKYLVPIEVLKLMQMNVREGYNWEPVGEMFALVKTKSRGQPIAIAARFPNTRDPWSFHICTAEFVKKFGTAPPAKPPSNGHSM